MLKKLLVKNLQSHKRIEITFDPFVTTIVGATDVGKSSIIRALGLVCLNRWDSSYVRNDKGHVTVMLDIDGKHITRKKGKGVNVYKIGTKEFKAFATDIPEEISRTLNIAPENFQRQLDPHFWFTETPGRVSKNLNAIVNLGLIDRSLGSVATKLRKAKAEVEVSSSRLEEIKRKKNSLQYVTNLDKELSAVEEAQADHESASQNRIEIAKILDNTAFVRSKINTLSIARLDGDKLIYNLRVARRIRNEAKNLNRLIKQVEDANKYADLPVPDMSQLLAFRKQADQVAENRRNLEMTLDELLIVEKELCVVNQEYEVAESQLLQLQKQTKVCPLCRRPLLLPKKEIQKAKGQVPQLQSSSQTSISGTHARCLAPKKGTGTKQWGGIQTSLVYSRRNLTSR